MIVLLTTDLFFSTRIRSVAETAGIAVRMALSSAQAIEACREPDVTGLLVDLETPGLSIAALMGELQTPRPLQVAAYGPHVHQPRLDAARQAGCELVLSRGQLDRDLTGVLSQLATAHPA